MGQNFFWSMAAKSGNLNKDGVLALHNNDSNLGVVKTFSFHISKTEKYLLKKSVMEVGRGTSFSIFSIFS